MWFKKRNIFDVVIIGAGPAGLSAAAEISKTDLKVCLIDKNGAQIPERPEIKGTETAVMAELGLEECIANKYQYFGMYSENDRVIYDFHENKSCTINFFDTLRALKKRSSCNYIEDEVIDITYKRNNVSVIGMGGKKYESKLLIDCSGNSFVTLKSLKLKRPEVIYHCISVLLSGCDIPPESIKEMSLYFNLDICNSAFWLYPLDAHNCQIGIGEMEPYKTISGNELKDNLLRSTKSGPFKEWLQNSKIEEDTFTWGHNPVIQPLEEMQQDRIMIVGDSAGMSTPLVGDGIRTSLIGGRNAAVVAGEAFATGNFSKKFLSRHEKMWWERYGKYYIWTIIMRHLICEYFTNQDWDEVIKRLKLSVDYDEFWNIISSHLTFSRFKKLLDFKITEDILKTSIEKYLPHLNIFNRKHETATFM